MSSLCASHKLSAVLLAAGSASRMGHRPKCLLELNGSPLIRGQLEALLSTGVNEIVVVLGHYADQIEAAIEDMKPLLKIVRNSAPDSAQAASLRAGLQALSPQCDAVLVALADQPLIKRAHVQDLITAFESRPAGTHLVQPTVNGLPGNPVMFSATVRTQILQGDVKMGGRQWQAAHPEQVYAWPSTERAYRCDIDTQDDIEALAKQTGQRLQWPADMRQQ